jgi:hypothetical protein
LATKKRRASGAGATKAPARRVRPTEADVPAAKPRLHVQAYIAAMPGWKREVGRRLDALIVRTVPHVRKAVRWNSPFYGIEGKGWFLGLHCIARYVKVAFFRGMSLRPIPPGESKQKEVRYLHVHEGESLDEELVTGWVRQASKLPGDECF